MASSPEHSRRENASFKAAEAAGSCRSCAVMVRVHGPDPKGRKMREHAFYSSDSGDTALSSSGVLFPQCNRSAVVVTCASIVEPFLLSRPPQEQHKLELIRGAELEVLLELGSNERGNAPLWVPAQLVKLMNVSRASEVLKALLDAQGGSNEGAWEIGWTLAQVNGNNLGAELVTDNKTEDFVAWKGSRKEIALEGYVSTNSSIAATCTKIAVFSLQRDMLDINFELKLSDHCARGDMIRAVGSPFGVLSPLHFFNSISVGIVSNSWPASSKHILMADIRCLPGMEGGPVFDDADNFVGMLLRPLRQRSSGGEVQLIMSGNILLSALKEEGIEVSYGDISPDTQTPGQMINKDLRNAVSSVVLITVNDGTWASGIVLNSRGLILTNAHLLEPWRFGKTFASNSSTREDLLETVSCHSSSSSSSINRTTGAKQHLRVRVRHHSWHNARVVFVSQGPLDVALLQMTSMPPGLQPIIVETSKPVPGSSAFVIGHGLFGPRSELGPSVSAGVVSRVVEAGQAIPPVKEQDSVMLQTTAAVHPGGSGGAVVNNQGHMIGLVTSNTKHNKRTLIPYLNFSIPCAALQPIFEFASSDVEDLSLLSILDKHNEMLSTVWALVPPQLPWNVQRDRVKKGTKFAAFIADKQSVLLQQPQQEEGRSKPLFTHRSCL